MAYRTVERWAERCRDIMDEGVQYAHSDPFNSQARPGDDEVFPSPACQEVLTSALFLLQQPGLILSVMDVPSDGPTDPRYHPLIPLPSYMHTPQPAYRRRILKPVALLPDGTFSGAEGHTNDWELGSL